MWLALHDKVGPRNIGNALNLLDAKKQDRRVNHVRYYGFADLQRALSEVVPDKREEIAKLFAK